MRAAHAAKPLSLDRPIGFTGTERKLGIEPLRPRPKVLVRAISAAILSALLLLMSATRLQDGLSPARLRNRPGAQARSEEQPRPFAPFLAPLKAPAPLDWNVVLPPSVQEGGEARLGPVAGPAPPAPPSPPPPQPPHLGQGE